MKIWQCGRRLWLDEINALLLVVHVGMVSTSFPVYIYSHAAKVDGPPNVIQDLFG